MTSVFSLSSPCWLNWCKTNRRFLMYLKFWIDVSCIDFNKEREAFSRSDYKGCPAQGPGVWVEGGGGAWVPRAGGAGVGEPGSLHGGPRNYTIYIMLKQSYFTNQMLFFMFDLVIMQRVNSGNHTLHSILMGYWVLIFRSPSVGVRRSASPPARRSRSRRSRWVSLLGNTLDSGHFFVICMEY